MRTICYCYCRQIEMWVDFVNWVFFVDFLLDFRYLLWVKIFAVSFHKNRIFVIFIQIRPLSSTLCQSHLYISLDFHHNWFIDRYKEKNSETALGFRKYRSVSVCISASSVLVVLLHNTIREAWKTILCWLCHQKLSIMYHRKKKYPIQ